MDSSAARRVGAVFEALLLQRVLEPLARADAVLGDYGSTCLAEAIARSDAGGFGAAIARELERTHG